MPYSSSELMDIINRAEETEKLNRTITQKSQRYWELRFLEENYLNSKITGRLCGKLPSFMLASLQPYPIKGKLPLQDEYVFGKEITVQIQDINPAFSSLKLMPVKGPVNEQS